MTKIKLSRRELQVAELLAWGSSKKEVADKLSISPNTVDNISRSLYAKVGIQKASELSAWWICTKYGITRDESPKSDKLLPFHKGCSFKSHTRVSPGRNGKYRVDSIEFSYVNT